MLKTVYPRPFEIHVSLPNFSILHFIYFKGNLLVKVDEKFQSFFAKVFEDKPKEITLHGESVKHAKSILLKPNDEPYYTSALIQDGRGGNPCFKSQKFE